MVKLIASDLDGTVVKEGTFDINVEYEEIFSKLIDRGVVIALASGRHYKNIVKLFPKISDKVYLISDGGATLRYKGEVLMSHHIDTNVSIDLLKFIHDNLNSEVAISTDTGYYTETRDEYINNNVFTDAKEVNTVVDDVSKYLNATTKFTMMSDIIVEDAIKLLSERYKDDIDIVRSGSIWIDILPKGVSKGDGVKFIQDKLHIDRNESVAFGNSDNDIKMLLECKDAFVVDDATYGAKMVATKIIPNVFNDGTLKELKKILSSL